MGGGGWRCGDRREVEEQMSKRARRSVAYEDLGEHDRAEIDKFKQFLHVHAACKAGADPDACAMLEQAIYPDMVTGKAIGDA